MKLFLVIFLAFSSSILIFAQTTEKVEAQLALLDYPRSDSIRRGSKFGKLTDANLKSSGLPTGRVLLWVSRSDFADTRAENVQYSNNSSGSPQRNFGNLALSFFANKNNINQAILFYEGRQPRPIASLDVTKVKSQFSGYSIFLDKDDTFSEKDTAPEGTLQQQQGLYLVENNVVRCRFLELSEKNKFIEGIALEFIKSGKVSDCPLELVKNDKLENIKPLSFIIAAQGNEYQYTANDFGLTRVSYPDGKYEIKFVNGKAASRFVLDKLTLLAKKNKFNLYLLVRKTNELEKMKKAFPDWEIITDNNDTIWSSLSYALLVIDRKSKVSSSQIVFPGAPESANPARLEAILRDARR